MARQKKQKEKNKSFSSEKLARQLAELFEGGYLNQKHIYRVNFIRGLFFGLGATLGGTILIALILWVLSLFTEIPLIGRIAESIRQAIENSQ